MRSFSISIQFNGGTDCHVARRNLADVTYLIMPNQIIVADIFIYPERLDADVRAQFPPGSPLGMLQGLVGHAPKPVGGQPYAPGKNGQDKCGERRNQSRPTICKFGRVPGGVGNLGPPRADFVITQAMICNARATGHFLAYRNLKAGCRPPRESQMAMPTRPTPSQKRKYRQSLRIRPAVPNNALGHF